MLFLIKCRVHNCLNPLLKRSCFHCLCGSLPSPSCTLYPGHLILMCTPLDPRGGYEVILGDGPSSNMQIMVSTYMHGWPLKGSEYRQQSEEKGMNYRQEDFICSVGPVSTNVRGSSLTGKSFFFFFNR